MKIEPSFRTILLRLIKIIETIPAMIKTCSHSVDRKTFVVGKQSTYSVVTFSQGIYIYFLFEMAKFALRVTMLVKRTHFKNREY